MEKFLTERIYEIRRFENSWQRRCYDFQEPMTSLNPVYTVGDQIMEMILNHSVTEEENRASVIVY